MIADFTVDKFYGLQTSVKDIKTLKPGYSPDAKNWLTSKFNDAIELRRGYARLGSNLESGNGKITGMGIGLRYDGSQVPFFSHGRKLKYYDSVSNTTVEIGTDTLPAPADGEDVWFKAYQGLAGSFMFCGSPNSGVYKIPASNPGSVVDQQVSNYRWGVFHIGQNRAFAGQRNGTASGNNDKTGLYLSYIDKDQLSDYTAITNEVLGAAGSLTYSGTLAQISGVRTAMYVEISDGVETFKDDRNGNLVGSAGGTGTINYATGVYSVTFNAVAAGQVEADYYYEVATTTGILDFTGSGTGQGKSFRQDDGGGKLMAVFNINTIEYCIHELKTWQLTTAIDDTQTTNLPYRNVGIPYERSAFQTPDGILLADNSRPTDPKFRKMQVLDGTDIATIEPLSISDDLDLSIYGFTKCVAFRWGDYEIFCVQEKVNDVANTHNSIMLIHNVVSNAWDKLDYFASCLEEYNGTLIAGDSVSNNVYTLFSGFDDDNSVIPNYWTSSDLNLGTENLKSTRRMIIDGLIQADQQIKVSISYDGRDFVDVFTVDGSGSYVDTGIEVTIGSNTVGSTGVGGGAQDTASPFEVNFALNSGNYTFARVRFEALGVGYASINSFTFHDNRNKGRKSIPSRMV